MNYIAITKTLQGRCTTSLLWSTDIKNAVGALKRFIKVFGQLLLLWLNLPTKIQSFWFKLRRGFLVFKGFWLKKRPILIRNNYRYTISQASKIHSQISGNWKSPSLRWMGGPWFDVPHQAENCYSSPPIGCGKSKSR